MKLKIALGSGIVLLFVVSIISFVTMKAQSLKDDAPKVTTSQLQSENGVIPVEILNPQATFKTENSVDNISFVVRNNSNKSIRSVCLAYSIQIERNKVKTQDTFYHVVETFVHKDIQEIGYLKPVSLGQETIISENGEISYESDSTIKGIEARIDYVEFEDGTILGNNRKGGQLVSLIRDGANEYRDFLAQKYTESGKSIDALILLIQDSKLPLELKFNSEQQNFGANLYRRHLLRFYEGNGVSELSKFINKNLVAPKNNRKEAIE